MHASQSSCLTREGKGGGEEQGPLHAACACTSRPLPHVRAWLSPAYMRNCRETVYDEDNDVVEEPKDDGGRHRLWVRHEARQGNMLHR
jgi:hypothetical protein